MAAVVEGPLFPPIPFRTCHHEVAVATEGSLLLATGHWLLATGYWQLHCPARGGISKPGVSTLGTRPTTCPEPLRGAADGNVRRAACNLPLPRLASNSETRTWGTRQVDACCNPLPPPGMQSPHNTGLAQVNIYLTHKICGFHIGHCAELGVSVYPALKTLGFDMPSLPGRRSRPLGRHGDLVMTNQRLVGHG